MNRTQAARTAVLSPEAKPEPAKPKEGHRETVEAIVVAMILALLVRGFEAEAFVIPTGSMAPTLMGRHKEVVCPQCGYLYAVNASVEDDGHQLGIAGIRLGSKGGPRSPTKVVAGTCVNCRFLNTELGALPTFNGDRILVMKFPYDMPSLPGSSPPSRWDVVVFRYPEEPEVSYIKRLVGLPGEELRIWHGDVYIRPQGAKEFRLERKPLRHLRSMQMMVYDDRYRAKALSDKPEWRRWTSETKEGWSESKDPSSEEPRFDVSVPAGQEAQLRYHNLVPDPDQWEALSNQAKPSRPPRPTLITDFYSYNTNQTADSRGEYESSWIQPHWVGDLGLSARLDVKQAQGVVRIELIEGGVVNRCELDLEKGVANLFHGTQKLNREPSARVINGQGVYDVAFSNIDDRLTLLVNGQPVFGDGIDYDDTAPRPLPTQADLAPAAITAVGATLGVSQLVLKRDIYYTLNPGRMDYGNLWDDHYPRNTVELFDNLAEPSRFSFLANLPSKDFPISADHFLMLGDNSPMSKDSRGWSTDDRDWDPSDRKSWEVPRDLLTGKAFFVYWPHGKPFGPDIRLGPDFRVPFRPYLERMKWIR